MQKSVQIMKQCRSITFVQNGAAGPLQQCDISTEMFRKICACLSCLTCSDLCYDLCLTEFHLHVAGRDHKTGHAGQACVR